MLLFLLVFLILFIFVHFVLFEFLLDFVYFFVKKTTDIGLLFYENFGGFVLNCTDVVLDLFVQFADVLHSVPVCIVKAALRSK